MRWSFYKKTDATLDPKVLSGVVDLCDARARWDGRSIPVSRRVAKHDHIHYLDLCDESWRVAKLDRAAFTYRPWRLLCETFD